MLLNIIFALLAAALLLAVILLARTYAYTRRLAPAPPPEKPAVDARRAAEHLAAAIRCQTISYSHDQPPARAALTGLHDALVKMYPRLHAALERQIINEFSLLYTWQGSQPSLPPVVLAAHLDVVPVEEASLGEWQHPPFSGEIADGFVWGRGALDIKNQVIAPMEAIEALIASGYRPQRTVYLAFGHDEEVGGLDGARQITAWMAKQGIRPLVVLDEGGSALQGVLPGVEAPVALVGVAEKGYLTLKLTVEGTPGHSSMPPAQTAIGILGRGLARLEAAPLPARLEMLNRMFQALGDAAPFMMRLVFANQWLFGGWLRGKLSANPQTNATIRTTTAITMISGGVKDNLLPSQASAGVNFRLLPGNSVADVCRHVQEVIGDERVRIETPDGAAWEASPLSPSDTPVYRRLESVIRQAFDAAPVAPYLVLGATDARYYTALCENVYRFTPMLARPDDLARVHGNNERIAISELERMVQFYLQLVRAWGEETLE